MAWNERSRFRERFSRSATDGIGREGGGIRVSVPPTTVRIVHDSDCVGSGSGILIVAYPEDVAMSSSPCPALASSRLGDRRSSPFDAGRDAARELVECVEGCGCVDRWMQDQLIPFMALADDDNGRSEMLCGELTLHTQTAMRVAERMTGCEFEVERVDDDRGGEDDGGNDGGDGNGWPHYGENGRVLGRHVIRCRGIGFACPGTCE